MRNEEPPRRVLPSVLVVEDRADRPVGHRPVLFAEVAGRFAAVGCRVGVLTARGWYLDGEKAVPFPVYQYGWVARAFAWLADCLHRNRRSGRWRGWLRRAGEVLRVVVIARAAATGARMMGDGTVVVVVSNVDAPELIAALGGRGRWLSYVFFSPHRPTTLVGACGYQVVRRVAQSLSALEVRAAAAALWVRRAPLSATSGRAHGRTRR